jgi:hypothetical protein
MAATPPKKSIVNPTLVGVDAGGAVGGSQKSGKGLVEMDVFRVSSNLDTKVPRWARLPRSAAGDNAIMLVPTDDAAAPVPTDATDALGRQATTPTKRRREGPSRCKRKQAREEIEAPAPVDNDKSVHGMVNAVPGEEEGGNPLASEVSKDEGDVEVGNDIGAKGVNPPQNPKSPPLVIARKSNGRLEDNGDNDMEAFGYLNHDPHSVGSIFTRRAADERLAGLDVAARVWSTTKQLLGDSPAAQKLARATAALKDRA